MKKIIRFLPSLIMMFLINIVSGTPGPTIEGVGLGNEKVHIIGHFFMFFLLYLTYFYATKKILLSLILAILYGIFDEYHQKFIYLRSASFFDIKINALGAVFAMVIVKLCKKILKYEKNSAFIN